ncbi:DUF4426 domain-containing protein [Arsukibacterium indicum]|uniref:DUF4426 domain-containing protein n=1 Tax=Arsukibacterium indicum TaxID=2848612 RepID=A0ABS6MIP7_9GAMM|nr:DUF4426 domain-containing protein [Arsukibacterium indicum]MBV2128679.1 DUF4426 domain-containing protein [Arsukibacterium indicum]
MSFKFSMLAAVQSAKHLFATIIAAVFLTACERPAQNVAPAEPGNNAEVVIPDKPLGHVMELDGYTLRANITRADILNQNMAEKYGIAPNPDLALLNLVIQDNSEPRQDATVAASVHVEHENLLGHTQVIDMRKAETDGYISYYGTLDASSQRIFQLNIKAQPADTDQVLEMSFEARLDW